MLEVIKFHDLMLYFTIQKIMQITQYPISAEQQRRRRERHLQCQQVRSRIICLSYDDNILEYDNYASNSVDVPRLYAALYSKLSLAQRHYILNCLTQILQLANNYDLQIEPSIPCQDLTLLRIKLIKQLWNYLENFNLDRAQFSEHQIDREFHNFLNSCREGIIKIYLNVDGSIRINAECIFTSTSKKEDCSKSILALFLTIPMKKMIYMDKYEPAKLKFFKRSVISIAKDTFLKIYMYFKGMNIEHCLLSAHQQHQRVRALKIMFAHQFPQHQLCIYLKSLFLFLEDSIKHRGIDRKYSLGITFHGLCRQILDVDDQQIYLKQGEVRFSQLAEVMSEINIQVQVKTSKEKSGCFLQGFEVIMIGYIGRHETDYNMASLMFEFMKIEKIRKMFTFKLPFYQLKTIENHAKKWGDEMQADFVVVGLGSKYRKSLSLEYQRPPRLVRDRFFSCPQIPLARHKENERTNVENIQSFFQLADRQSQHPIKYPNKLVENTFARIQQGVFQKITKITNQELVMGMSHKFDLLESYPLKSMELKTLRIHINANFPTALICSLHKNLSLFCEKWAKNESMLYLLVVSYRQKHRFSLGIKDENSLQEDRSQLIGKLVLITVGCIEVINDKAIKEMLIDEDEEESKEEKAQFAQNFTKFSKNSIERNIQKAKNCPIVNHLDIDLFEDQHHSQNHPTIPNNLALERSTYL